MTKHNEDIKIIRFCKAKGCGVRFSPQQGSQQDYIGLCIVHRREKMSGPDAISKGEMTKRSIEKSRKRLEDALKKQDD